MQKINQHFSATMSGLNEFYIRRHSAWRIIYAAKTKR